MRLALMIPAAALATVTLLGSAAVGVAQEPSASPLPAAASSPPSPATSPASSSGTPESRAARAAEDATKKAQMITLEARHDSSMTGSVFLTQIGRTRTRVTVRIPNPGAYNLSIYQGSDCVDNLTAARSAIALAPLNSAASNAPESSTIVDLPIEKLQSGNYLLDVRSATERATLAQACAKLSR